MRTKTEDEYRVALRNFLIETVGRTEEEVEFTMSLLSILDSRHSRDILQFLNDEYCPDYKDGCHDC